MQTIRNITKKYDGKGEVIMASEKDLSNTIVRCRILSVTEEGYVLCEADAEEKR